MRRGLCSNRRSRSTPTMPRAITGLAQTYANERLYGWGNSGIDYDAKILGPLDRAIALAPDYDAPYVYEELSLGGVAAF